MLGAGARAEGSYPTSEVRGRGCARLHAGTAERRYPSPRSGAADREGFTHIRCPRWLGGATPCRREISAAGRNTPCPRSGRQRSYPVWEARGSGRKATSCLGPGRQPRAAPRPMSVAAGRRHRIRGQERRSQKELPAFEARGGGRSHLAPEAGGGGLSHPTPEARRQPWDFYGRNDDNAETSVLWTPHAKS